jgi:hypothetical protein
LGILSINNLFFNDIIKIFGENLEYRNFGPWTIFFPPRFCQNKIIFTFEILNFGHCDLPFDWAQGGESFDFAQDREPVERPVEPFGISGLSGLGCD